MPDSATTLTKLINSWPLGAPVNQEYAMLTQVNDHLMAVPADHRRPDLTYGPPLVTVSTQVVLSLEDVAALLYHRLDAGMACAELLDDDNVREVVADTVLNAGCLGLAKANFAAAGTPSDRGDASLLAYCRQRATAVFAIP